MKARAGGGESECVAALYFLLSVHTSHHLPPSYPRAAHRSCASLSPPALRVLHHDRAVAVVAVGSAAPAAQRLHVQAPAQAGSQEALQVGGGALR